MDKEYDQFGFAKPTKITEEEKNELERDLCELAVNYYEGFLIYLKCDEYFQNSESYKLHLATLTEEELEFVKERREIHDAILEGIRQYREEIEAS